MSFRRRSGDRIRERGVHDHPVPWASRASLALLLPVGVALQRIVSRDPRVADAWMGTGYPLVARALGMLTGWLPFSVAEVLVLVGGVGLLLALLRNVRRMRRGSRHLGNLVAHAASGTAALAGLFFALWLTWGLGFHRTPLAERAGYDMSPASAAELGAMAAELLDLANAARREVEEDGDGVMRLRGTPRQGLGQVRYGFERAAQIHEPIATGYAGRVKQLALFSGVMTRAGLDGCFVALTGEASVNPEQPAPALAFAACHQAAHQIGWAREAEAEFAGYLACTLHPDADFRYAARLAALRDSLKALAAVDSRAGAELMARRSPAVVRDWAAWQRDRGGMVELLVADRRRESGRRAGTP